MRRRRDNSANICTCSKTPVNRHIRRSACFSLFIGRGSRWPLEPRRRPGRAEAQFPRDRGRRQQGRVDASAALGNHTASRPRGAKGLTVCRPKGVAARVYVSRGASRLVLDEQRQDRPSPFLRNIACALRACFGIWASRRGCLAGVARTQARRGRSFRAPQGLFG